MRTEFRYGKEILALEVPNDSQVYQSNYPKAKDTPSGMLLSSVENTTGCPPLKQLLAKRRTGNVVIVVSDITRPIPYTQFLPELIDSILKEGIRAEKIVILVATGMHRASTQAEKIQMFGEDIVRRFRIVDHDAENESELKSLEGKSWSGNEIKLNKYFVEAGFRILTGLVEPHFMAGFSGGRKAICPGLASLSTIQMFHGYGFLSHPNASNAVLENNPCHMENTSVAKICPADFSINIVLDQHKAINKIISGDQFISHEKTIEYVRSRCCVQVTEPVDLAITSCGGYPLDDTFYQCVKGFVNCLPAIKERGEIIAFGNCSEGIGSPEYTSVMKEYSGRETDFLRDISEGVFFKKDQWQFQMHTRVIKKTGVENLHFFTSSILQDDLALLSVNPHSVSKKELQQKIQQEIDSAVKLGKKVAVFPEGPYCSAIL